MKTRRPALVLAAILLAACSDNAAGRDEPPATTPSNAVVTSVADPDDADYERELDEIDQVLDELDIEIGSDQVGSG